MWSQNYTVTLKHLKITKVKCRRGGLKTVLVRTIFVFSFHIKKSTKITQLLYNEFHYTIITSFKLFLCAVFLFYTNVSSFFDLISQNFTSSFVMKFILVKLSDVLKA